MIQYSLNLPSLILDGARHPKGCLLTTLSRLKGGNDSFVAFSMMSIALWLSVVFGLMFQFPLVTYALIRSKIVSYEGIKTKRPYVFVGILILSGLLTPPDVVSQLMLTIPTYLLFEAGLFMARRIKK